nr:hypothetical protein [Tanacetum cinerariifolium]
MGVSWHRYAVSSLMDTAYWLSEWTPSAHRAPTPTAVIDDVVQKKKRKQVDGDTSSPRKSLKVTIKQMKPTSTPMLPPNDDKEKDEIIEATILGLAIYKTAKFAEEQESEEKKDDKKDDDNDDDDNDDHIDHRLVKEQVKVSLENRNEKMETPIPSPHRSPRTNLSSDKTISQELTANGINENMDKVLHEIIPRIALNTNNDIIKDNLPRFITDTIIQERDTFLVSVPALISKEFVDHVLMIIEELFKNYVDNNVITVHPITSSSTASTTTNLQHQLYLKMKSNLQDQVDDP